MLLTRLAPSVTPPHCLRLLPACRLVVVCVCRLVLQASDVDCLLGHMGSLRHLIISRQPAGFGFGPYICADSGAAWDAQSVGVLMQVARTLPTLCVQLERPGMMPMPPH